LTNGLIKEKQTQQKSKLTNPLQKRGFLFILGIYYGMRGFIKSLLKEQEEKYDTLAMLSDYTGSNSKLQDLSRELKVLGKLSNTKIKDAVTQFKKEFYEPTILSSLQFNKQMQSLIMDLGTKAYNDILRSNKRFLLSDLNKVKIGTPEREWINRNVSDLRFFKRHITDTGEKFSFPDRDEKVSISDEITNLLKLLVKRDFWGFIEGDEWSILNKINTNYTNWSKLIAKRDKEGDLGNNGSPKDKVTNYFKQRPIEEIHDLSEFDEDQKRIVRTKIPTLSFADEDIITILRTAESPDTDYDFNKMRNRIMSTTDKGDNAEDNFIAWLLFNGIPKSDIRVFSSYGNLVDITFQCDLMVKFNDKWVPIQVKSSDRTTGSKLLNYGIGGILVYPAPKKIKCGRWIYITGTSLPKSFDEDFLNLHCQ